MGGMQAYSLLLETLILLLLTRSQELDHAEGRVGDFAAHLSEKQRTLLSEVDVARLRANATLVSQADATHMNVSEHLAYRYLQSCEWSAGGFHGTGIAESIVETVSWRYSYGIGRPARSAPGIASLVQQRLVYVSEELDKQGRAIIYVRANHEGKRESPETYLRLLMYSVERADRFSVEAPGGMGEFIAIVNLQSFSLLKVPPMISMTDGISLLKSHYPYRLGAVYIVNAGATFDFLWRVFKPLIPARALRKVFFVGKKELEAGVLEESVGRDRLERDSGGTKEPLPLATEGDVQRYFALGYWDRRAAAVEVEMGAQGQANL